MASRRLQTFTDAAYAWGLGWLIATVASVLMYPATWLVATPFVSPTTATTLAQLTSSLTFLAGFPIAVWQLWRRFRRQRIA